MSNNVFISIEFTRPDRTYDRVVHAISSLGESWAEIHFAHWYVNTRHSAAEICKRLKSVLDKEDKLIVIDTTNDEAAWLNLGAATAARLRERGF
jgi:hypothetical protein